MRLNFLLVTWLLLACASVAHGQEKPNTLTPTEISDGWILLYDGATDYGWKHTDTDAVKWSVADGELQRTGSAAVLSTTTEFGDFELRLEYGTMGIAKGGVTLTGSTGYLSIPLDSQPGNLWTLLTVTRKGNHVDYSVGGLSKGKGAALNYPRVAIGLDSPSQGTIRYRNIKLRPLGFRSLFNGRDLTGWTAIPDHKSVFSVTPDGSLNVKNGNGDLQTDSEWGDFVLQAQVYSNGDHLNSGIFFRANKGKFWSGYEDQIRNQWEGDDRTKAVDYGTGGIYNRMPARRVVSSDREWFTLTLVADGLHITSWVNGVLVADFTDIRPSDETNARNGSRTAPGVLSIQGHDPTTDLSFRDIRIVELPGLQR